MLRKERGAALIVVLLVLVLCASLLAGYGFRERQRFDRFGAFKTTDRLLLLGMSAESWVIGVLLEDAKRTSSDSLLEEWAQEVPGLPIEGGILSGRLIDLDRYVDINRFTDSSLSKLERELKFEASDIKLLQRLAELSGADIPAEAFYSLVDWQDKDDSRTFGGFESAEYQLKDNPYRALNGPLANTSELVSIEGFSDASYALLREHITAANPPVPTVNVNTASDLVLMSFWDKIDAEIADQLITARELEPWASKDQFFVTLAELMQVDVADIKGALDRKGYAPVAVESQRFQLRLKLELDGMLMNYNADLRRYEEGSGRLAIEVEGRTVTFDYLEVNG